jgi:hypothetical protein
MLPCFQEVIVQENPPLFMHELTMAMGYKRPARNFPSRILGGSEGLEGIWEL